MRQLLWLAMHCHEGCSGLPLRFTSVHCICSTQCVSVVFCCSLLLLMRQLLCFGASSQGCLGLLLLCFAIALTVSLSLSVVSDASIALVGNALS